MQQRRLRLGDILDDYCPRERRVTNHAVVAMIDDEVKQTRCTTCDADHEYKQARMPPQRRKRAGVGVGDTAEGAGRLRPSDDHATAPVELGQAAAEPDQSPESEAVSTPAAADESTTPALPADNDEGPVHRRLIRATLPRPDGQAPERKEPEFTIRQPGMRTPGGKRGRHQRPMRTQGGMPSRFGGTRHGSGQGSRPGGAPGHGHRQGGNRPGGQPGGPRGNRQGPGGGRGGRKRGR
jgi:hypothetical protein